MSMGDVIRAKLAAFSCAASEDDLRDVDYLGQSEGTFQVNRCHVEKGILIQDSVASEMCRQHIINSARQTSWILDGFPRTIQQAEALRSFAPPHACINFHLPANILLSKLLGRRICTTCGGNFNVADIYHPPFQLPAILPKTECVHCGGKPPLTKRSDDTKESIQRRLDLHEQLTTPMLKKYDAEGLLLNFEVVKGIDDIPRLEETIISFLRRKYKLQWPGVH